MSVCPDLADLQALDTHLETLPGGHLQDALQSLQPALQPVLVARRDKGADSVPADDDAFLFQVQQRLAQRGSRDPQLHRKLLLRGQLLARLVGSLLDQAEQVLLRLHRERDSIGSDRLHSAISHQMSDL